MRLHIALRRVWLVALLSPVMTLSGCGLYLHDQAAAAKSAATRDAWAKVSAEPNTSTALRNIDAVAKEELRMLEDQERFSLSLALQQAVSKNWAWLDAEAVELLRKNVREFGLAQAEAAAGVGDLGDLKAAFKVAGNALAAAEEAVTKERKAQEASRSVTTAPDLGKVIAELQTATAAISTGSTANLPKILKSLEGASATVGKLKPILERADKEPQPGLKLVMLGFALDVATAERDRLAEQIRQTTAALKAAQRRRDRLALVITDAAAILNQIHGSQLYVRNQLKEEMGREALNLLLPPPPVKKGEKKPKETLCGPPAAGESILLTLKRQADEIAADRRAASTALRPDCDYVEEGLEANVEALLRYASLVGYQRFYSRLEKHETQIADHRGARREDLVNSREREQLISRTLDGLALFYKGGITKEDIARIIALAEGLFISAGVNR